MEGESAAGKRILVAEDEFFVALVVEETLQSFSCTVLGPFADLAEAIEAATRQQVDAAVLDINLRARWSIRLPNTFTGKGFHSCSQRAMRRRMCRNNFVSSSVCESRSAQGRSKRWSTVC